MPLSNLELHWSIYEMQCAVGYFLDKISDLETGFKLKFGKNEIYAGLDRVHVTRLKQEAVAPHGFTQYCRKHLRGKLVRISQPNFDRVVVFEFDSGQKLVFEIFAKGNAILVGADGKTEKALRDEEWKDRTIKRGIEYKYPNSGKLDPREMTETEFQALFNQKNVIHSLIAGINMSKKYLELACERANIAKESNKPSKKLFTEIKKMLESYEPGIDTVPVVQKFTSEFEPRESFGEALDEKHSIIKPDTSSSERIKRKIKQQEDAISQLNQKAEEYKAKGDAIYEHWQELNTLIESIKEMREKGLSYDDINRKMEGKARIDKKTHKLTVIV